MKIIQFFKDVWYEMTQKVTWPTAKRLVTATTIIVSFVLVWAIIIFAFDSVFISAQKFIIEDYYDTVMLKRASDGKVSLDQVQKFNTSAERDAFMAEKRKNKEPGYDPQVPFPDEVKQPDGTTPTIPLTPGSTSPTTPPSTPITIPTPTPPVRNP
jgi:preprotein translocase SecE subunit